MDMEYMGGPLGWNIGWKKGKVQMKYRKGLDEILEGLDEIKERFRWNIGKVQMEYRKGLDGKKERFRRNIGKFQMKYRKGLDEIQERFR